MEYDTCLKLYRNQIIINKSINSTINGVDRLEIIVKGEADTLVDNFMNETLRIVLTFVIPAIVVFLFWTIPNNFFIAWGMGIPSSIGTGILFLLIDYFFTDKHVEKNKFLIRILVFLFVFIVVTVIYLFLEEGEIIAPLKHILKYF